MFSTLSLKNESSISTAYRWLLSSIFHMSVDCVSLRYLWYKKQEQKQEGNNKLDRTKIIKKNDLTNKRHNDGQNGQWQEDLTIDVLTITIKYMYRATRDFNRLFCSIIHRNLGLNTVNLIKRDLFSDGKAYLLK